MTAARVPAIFDRGPSFESLTEAARRGAALARPLLQVVGDAADMGICPTSVSV